MMKRIFWFLTIIFNFIDPDFLYAQTGKPQYSVAHYTTDNGLPQSSVKDIGFDKAGYCWLMTEMGLVRFDGRQFKVYGTGQIKGLKSDRMEMVARGTQGNLYARAEGDQIITLNTQSQGSFLAPQMSVGQGVRLGHDGYAVMGGTKIKAFDKFMRSFPITKTLLYCVTRSGGIYTYSDEELYYFNRDLLKVVPLAGYERRPDSHTSLLGDEYFMMLRPGNQTKVWKGTVFQDNLTKITGDIEKNADYLKGKMKTLWCENGTFIYAGDNLYRIFVIKGRLSSVLVLTDLKIVAPISIYYVPQQDKYFFGSYTEGLYVVQRSIFTYPSIPQEVKGQNFYAQARVGESQVFIKDALLSATGPARHIPLETTDGVTFYATPGQEMYYERHFQLKKYDFKTGRSSVILNLANRLRSVFSGGADSSVVFCSRRVVGILRKDTVSVLKTLPPNVFLASGRKIGEDDFLLSTEAGLKWYNLNSNKIYRSVLDSCFVRTTMTDKDQRIWIATYGKGFYMYEKGKVYPMPFGVKQALKTVHAFIDDGLGYFWLPSNNGLFKVRKQDLVDYAHGKISDVYFYRMSKENGLRTNEFNGGCDPSFVWLKDSLLSLPSMNGLVWFYPRRTVIRYPDRNIYLDMVTMNGLELRKSERLIVPPDFRSLSFMVSSPYFGNAENLSLEYHFEGLTPGWIPVPENGVITFNGLPSGQYELQVRKGQGLYNRDPQILRVPVSIQPWFYNTWWFYSLTLLLLGLAGYLIILYREKSLKERSKILEKRVERRTSELNKAVENLEQSEMALLKSNQSKDKIITMVLHDLRSPIRFINSISNSIAKKADTITRDELVSGLSDLRLGSKALEIFTKDFFTWALSQSDSFVVKKTRFTVKELFSELEELYGEILHSRENRMKTEDAGLNCYSDYQILGFILRNLIDNANKNTRNGLIQLKARSEGESLIFSVTDTGKGMSEENIRNFLDETRNIGTEGTGSLLVLQMLKEIQAELDIQSVPDQGSVFTVRLISPQ
jgi:signal transduction histidine kinase